MARHQQLIPRSAELQRGFDPFLSLHREMNRLFDDVLRSAAVPASLRSDQGSAMLEPDIDVSETEKEIKICADLPGVSEQDVEVSLDEDMLTIRAERRHEHKEEKENYHLVERSFGTFQRSLRLPSSIDPDHVEARFENGVLRVTIPKKDEGQRSRKVQIQSSGQQSGGHSAREQGQQGRGGSARAEDDGRQEQQGSGEGQRSTAREQTGEGRGRPEAKRGGRS